MDLCCQFRIAIRTPRCIIQCSTSTVISSCKQSHIYIDVIHRVNVHAVSPYHILNHIILQCIYSVKKGMNWLVSVHQQHKNIPGCISLLLVYWDGNRNGLSGWRAHCSQTNIACKLFNKYSVNIYFVFLLSMLALLYFFAVNTEKNATIIMSVM